MHCSASRIILTVGVFLCVAQNAYAAGGVNTDSTVGYLPIGAGGGETIYVLPGTPGNLGIGLSSPGEALEVYQSTSGEISSEVWNGGTSAGTQSRFSLVTGTPNSYVLSYLQDGSGVPIYVLGAGPAVTQGIFQFPTYNFEDTSGKVDLSISGGNVAVTNALDVYGVATFHNAIGLASDSGLMGTSCSTAGQIQYDSTADMPVYCSSTSSKWQSMGGLPLWGMVHGTNDSDGMGTCDAGYTPVQFQSTVISHETVYWQQCLRNDAYAADSCAYNCP